MTTILNNDISQDIDLGFQIVQGRAMPLKAIPSDIHNNIPLILKIFRKFDKFSNDSLKKYEPQRKPYFEYQNMVPFFLQSLKSKQQLLVLKCLETKCDSIIQTVGSKEVDFEISCIKKFFIWIYQLGEILFGIFKSIKPLNGIKIGIKTREFGILAGTIFMVVGKAIYNKKTTKIRFDQAKYFIKNKQYLQTLFESKRKKKKAFLYFIYMPIFILTSIQLLKKIYSLMKKLVQQRQQAQRMLKRQPKVSIDSIICKKCHKYPRNIIFKPCFHFCYCKQCHCQFTKNLCPICHKEIKEIINIFVA